MTEQRRSRDLEDALRHQGAALRSDLAGRDLVPVVTAELRRSRGSRPAERAPRRAGRIVLVTGLALMIATSAAWAVGTILFDAGPVTVREGPPPDTASTVSVDLGRRVSAEQAQALEVFLQPTVPWLERSPTAWVDDDVPGQLSLTYPPQQGLPEIDKSGIGLLVQLFAGDGREVIRKYLTTDARAQRVDVRGDEAVFLSGGDHALFYLEAGGTYVSAPGRLVGNALILQRGGATVRIEGDVPLDRMVELAASLR